MQINRKECIDTVLVLGVVVEEARGALEQLGPLEAAAVLDAVARQQLLQLLHVEPLQLLGAPEALQIHVLRRLCDTTHRLVQACPNAPCSHTSTRIRSTVYLVSI